MLKKLTQSQQDTILERAVEEFGRNGLERAAISEIARRSDVSVGVIYKYYKNKDRYNSDSKSRILIATIGTIKNIKAFVN